MAVASQVMPSPFVASDDFRQCFDKKPFLYQHNLSTHELFSLPALKALAQKAASPERMNRKGAVREAMVPGFMVAKGQRVKWGSPEFQAALDEAFDNLEGADLRMKISGVNEYDGYREILEESKSNLSDLTGVDFRKALDHGIATIFIASPNETTPYHIDEEVNFLSQIRGIKLVRLFDGNDRSIVSERDMEGFWFGRSFIDQVPDSKFELFTIGPGQGVFQPPFYPHLITTGPEVSISLSFPFTKLHFPEAEVYRMNAYMRKFGVKPKPVGARPAVDHVKSRVVRSALSLKRKVLGS